MPNGSIEQENPTDTDHMPGGYFYLQYDTAVHNLFEIPYGIKHSKVANKHYCGSPLEDKSTFKAEQLSSLATVVLCFGAAFSIQC